MVAAHSLDRCQAPQLGERFFPVDVACVEDEIDPVENLENSGGQPIEEPWAVRVSDDADTRRIRGDSLRYRALLDAGGGKPGRVSAGSIGAGVQRMHCGSREGMRPCLI